MKRCLIALALAAALPFAASAQDANSGLSYNYVQGGYVSTNTDGGDFEGDVYGHLGALVKFNQSWGVTADVKVADGDTQWMVGPRLSW